MSVAKTANEASVLKRMASILNLFSEGRTLITIDEVGEAIGVSPATAYRYVGELGGIGLLSLAIHQFSRAAQRGGSGRQDRTILTMRRRPLVNQEVRLRATFLG